MKLKLTVLLTILCLAGFSQAKKSTSTKSNTTSKIKVGLLNYYGSQNIPVSVFDATDSLNAYIDNNGVKEEVKVLSAEITFSTEGQTKFDKLKYGKISKELLVELKKMKPGIAFFIDNIILQTKDGKVITGSPIKYTATQWKVLNN